MTFPDSSASSTKSTLGPYDKRKTRTRCQACARRKIKCQGPFPCVYCVRTNKTCQPLQPASTPAVKFVVVRASSQDEELPITQSPPQPLSLLNESSDFVYMGHFAYFMAECQFTRSFAGTTIGSDLLPLVNESPLLRSLTLAIGALHSSRRATVRSSDRQNEPQIRAYRFYAEAMKGLRQRLETPNVAASDDVLWATFLLGLFELLTDTSGDPWATHMLYGTARLFQLSGAASVRATQLKGRLFDAFCILESKRALLFGDNTFLSQGEWLVPQQECDSQQMVEADHFLRLLPLMHKLSSFSTRFFSQLEAIPEAHRPNHPTIAALAHEGVAMQHQLAHQASSIFSYASSENDAYYLLARAFLCAMLLFHCKNFTYYSCWDHLLIPSLSLDEISTHCSAILTICGDMVKEPSGIPGVILLFPLRMVGVHVSDDWTRTEVLGILAQIRQQGFVVADRISQDLGEVWSFHDSISQILEIQ